MKKLYMLLAAMCLCLTAAAQEDDTTEAAASAALPFTALHYGPLSTAMGGASLAVSDSPAWASFTNVATVPFSEKKFDAALGYTLWQPSSTNYINLGITGNIRNKFGISGGLSMGIDRSFESTDEGGSQSGVFKPMDFQANLGFSYRFIKCLSAGVNARYAMQKVADGYTLSAVLFDAFLTGSFSGVTVSAGVSNAGTKAAFGKSAGISDKYPVPSAVAAGAGYSNTFAEKHAIDVAVDIRWYYMGFGVSASAGAAYTFNDSVAVRAGYLYGGDFCGDCATFGAGVKFFGVSLDATYMYMPAARANIVSLGLGYSF